MVIRSMTPADIDQLRVIHERYYKDKFTFPDFNSHYISCFTVTDDSNRIVSAGGVRTILENVILTDKGFTPSQRKEALLKILEFSLWLMKAKQYEHIHVFIENDPNWVSVLKRYGFEDVIGTPLVIG